MLTWASGVDNAATARPWAVKCMDGSELASQRGRLLERLRLRFAGGLSPAADSSPCAGRLSPSDAAAAAAMAAVSASSNRSSAPPASLVLGSCADASACNAANLLHSQPMTDHCAWPSACTQNCAERGTLVP